MSSVALFSEPRICKRIESFLTGELSHLSKKTDMALLGYHECTDTIKKDIKMRIPDYPMSVFRDAHFYVRTSFTTHVVIDLRGARVGAVQTDVVDFRLKQLFTFIEWVYLKTSVVFKQILLNNTRASIRAVLTCYKNTLNNRPIGTLTLSRAHVTENTLKFLATSQTVSSFVADNSALLKNIDGCKLLVSSGITNTKLTTLSVIDHTVRADAKTAQLFLQLFSKMHTLYLSPVEESDLLGLEDPVFLEPMKKPSFLTCGHVIDITTWDHILNKKCPTCRAPSQNPTPIFPRIAKLTRIEELTWKTELVDASRNPLSDRVWTHLPCGELFNIPDFKQTDLCNKKCSGCSHTILEKDLVTIFLKAVQKREEL